ncbi:hypothetical protein COO60DRAFT_1704577 [Scenedesmus sp. NREL 46B-D3]|nr:hypothetical protein COO60DRAFT_1704577 [Scenedesmus sp. NREL 46B-D3]
MYGSCSSSSSSSSTGIEAHCLCRASFVRPAEWPLATCTGCVAGLCSPLQWTQRCCTASKLMVNKGRHSQRRVSCGCAPSAVQSATAQRLSRAAVVVCSSGLHKKQAQLPLAAYSCRFDSPADRQHIKQQRAAIWAWFRGLGSNLIKHGVNLTKVPLPVELCEARSFLQRLTDSWCYTDLLHAAAAASDPVERLKLVVAFAVGGMRQQVSCDKPFNPILGETLQGRFPCGCSVFAEQVSHHPPVSCWQLLDHNGQFEYSGSSCWSATFTGNSVKGSQSGDSTLRFASDGAVITWSLPSIHIRGERQRHVLSSAAGVLFGDRVVKYHDTIVFSDLKNGLRCELSIDPAAPSKKGLVKRIIGKARHPRSKGGHDQLLGDLARLRPGAAEVLLDSCSGTWLTELAWAKGVRSVTMLSASQAAPATNTATAPARTPQQQAAAVDDDAGSVGCHSIGSFSTTSSSSIHVSDAGQGAAAGEGQPASSGREASSSSSSPESRLTASALAVHTQEAEAGGVAQAAAAAAAAGQGSGGGSMAALPSSAALSSSDATGHRCGRGMSVTKKLWDVKASKVWRFEPLHDDDPQLLPSDHRYRPDVQAHGGGARDAALRWKLVLEQRQRSDRALREQAGVRERGGLGHQHCHSTSSTKLGSAEELPGAGVEPGQPASNGRQH